MSKNLESLAANLKPLAKNFPSQNVEVEEREEKKRVEVNPDDPLRPYQFQLRKSLKGELKELAAKRGMTMQAFILHALKKEGLNVDDDDLVDRRSR